MPEITEHACESRVSQTQGPPRSQPEPQMSVIEAPQSLSHPSESETENAAPEFVPLPDGQSLLRELPPGECRRCCRETAPGGPHAVARHAGGGVLNAAGSSETGRRRRSH